MKKKQYKDGENKLTTIVKRRRRYERWNLSGS